MNTLLIIVVVVALCYFGGAKCPKVLKDNKEMLLGVLVGLALCSFMGVRLEGIENSNMLSGGRLEIASGSVINQMDEGGGNPAEICEKKKDTPCRYNYDCQPGAARCNLTCDGHNPAPEAGTSPNPWGPPPQETMGKCVETDCRCQPEHY